MSRMRRGWAWLVFLVTATLTWAAPPNGGPALPLSPDEQIVRAAHLPTDGQALLDFFRQRAALVADQTRMATLLQQLGDTSAEVQERAFAALFSIGMPALPALRQVANNLEDLAAAAKARDCLRLIEGAPVTASPGAPVSPAQVVRGSIVRTGAAITSLRSGMIPAAAARLVASQRPAGATEVLLTYLPFADDDAVTREVEAALGIVAFDRGQPNPAILQALADAIPVRRAAAAVLLCQVAGTEQQARVRPLLKDPKPVVRLRVAQALAERNVPEAVPVLIELLCELPPSLRAQAHAALARIAGEWAVAPVQTADTTAQGLRRDAWLAWWRNLDGPMLLEEFRQRTLPNPEREQVLGLVRQLGADAATTRERASTALLALGNAATPLLRQAANGSEPRTSQYASKLIQLMDDGPQSPLPAAALRLLTLRKPPGAAEALLAYLPFAENRASANQVQTALAAIAIRDGKAAPVLRNALADEVGQRRAAAAEILCQAQLSAELGNVRKLLQDPEPEVRQRVALALARARDREGIPVLIALLDVLPRAQAGQVEEFLTRLAGASAPVTVSGEGEAVRRKHVEAWQAWWTAHGSSIDLAKLDDPSWLFGYTLLVEPTTAGRPTGRVLELDVHGKPCWQIDGLIHPLDAHLLPGGRVLIAEHNGMRVTERDLKGNILWQKVVALPLSCQRLANGHTFIVTRGLLLEVDKGGQEVFTHKRPNPDIVTARKYPDGQVLLLTNALVCSRLDATGKEMKSQRLNFIQYWTGTAEFLPNEHLLVPQSYMNRVVEYDFDGKVIWEAPVTQPAGATRASNGNTLIVSQQYPARLLELDPVGKVVWDCREYILPGRARRR